MKTAALKKIKALVLDCDGILTNAQVFYNGDKGWCRLFSIRDGFGIKKLQQQGLLVSVITTSKTEDIRERMKTLKIEKWYEGAQDKEPAWLDFLKTTGLKASEVAYMGDDDPDMPLLKAAGFAATVPAAFPAVKSLCDYVTKREGGMGAVREVCELILNAQSKRKDSKK